jgi:hypothetical protein
VLAAWDEVQIVGPEHFTWALRFVRYSHGCLLSFVESMTDSPVVVRAQKIEAIMRDALAGRNSIAVEQGLVPHSPLLKKARVSSEEMKQAIKHLESAGTLEIVSVPRTERGGPRSHAFYRLLG